MLTDLRHAFRGRYSLQFALLTPFLGYITSQIIRSYLRRSDESETNRHGVIVPSPRTKVEALSAEERRAIPYPLDGLPGARDVDTIYGTIRVYEWGPASGRKVLFIHGISTPSIALSDMAMRLVEDHGCRVMLFDLFGRGYSDAPDPYKCPQDARLFTTQILLVLASSENSWTGSSGRFTLIGYSLGGGIAVSFAAYMPHLVESLVLIAPGGIVRPERMAKSGGWLYNDVLPQSLVEWLVLRRLQGTSGPEGSGAKQLAKADVNGVIEPTLAIDAEIPTNTPAHRPETRPPSMQDRANKSIAEIVAWQIDSHAAFVASFISSMKHAPISNQHQSWRRFVLREQRSNNTAIDADDDKPSTKRKVLLLLAQQDEVLVSEEIANDALGTVGPENVEVVYIDAAHGLVVSHASECVEAIVRFWRASIL